MSNVYLIGSLANPKIPAIANMIETRGHSVFAGWFSPGPDADVFWRDYAMARGRNFVQALAGPYARNVFEFDRRWLDWADVGMLVLPAGRSGHLELGYLIGRGKRGLILLEEPNPPRWDVMYGFATAVSDDLDHLMEGF